MREFITFDFILQDHDATEQEAIDCARSMDWMEIETSRQTIRYHNHLGTWSGVDVYYDYCGDYYFFCPSAPEAAQ